MPVALIKCLLRLTAWLPLNVAHSLGALIGRLMTLVPNRLQRVARRNIALCFPELADSARRQLLRDSLIANGQLLCETGIFWQGAKRRLEKLVIDVTGEKYIRQGLARDKGVILVSPHLGNWEVAGLYWSTRYPITNLYRPPRIQALDSLMRQARQRHGARLAPTNAQGVRALYQALGRNELIGILPDQDPREPNGAFAPFFGLPANTMTLLSRLAHKTGAAVVFTYAERLPRNAGFRLHCMPAPATLASADLTTSINALNAMVEHCVRATPAQYQWGYKRFLTRPPGQPPLYKRLREN